MVKKIVSGGQTGVDRAALDVAISLRMDYGGWCPKNRRAEDGRIPDRYALVESDSTNYAERTALNVRDSDGTLILTGGALSRGTGLTHTFAQRYGRPVMVVDLRQEVDRTGVERWLAENKIVVLNVAGPRESQQPGIYARAVEFLTELLSPAAAHRPVSTRRRSGPSKRT